jgi:hypothetical protein
VGRKSVLAIVWQRLLGRIDRKLNLLIYFYESIFIQTDLSVLKLVVAGILGIVSYCEHTLASVKYFRIDILNLRII